MSYSLVYFFYLYIYIDLGKNSNLKGSKKFIVKFELVWMLKFGRMNTAAAKKILPGFNGFRNFSQTISKVN